MYCKNKITLVLLSSIYLNSLFLPSCLSKDYWELNYQGRQRVVKSIAIYKEWIFIGTGNGIFISKDNGKTWNDFGTNRLFKDNNGNSLINWIYIDKRNKKIYLATSFGAFYSGVKKADWQKILNGTKTELNQINSIYIYKGNAYISSSDGFLLCKLKQNTCSRINHGLVVDNLSGNHEAYFTLKVSGRLYLGTSNGVYYFDNSSLEWIEITNGIQRLPSSRINAKHLLFDKDGNLWLACGTGIYFSSNKGKSWEKRSERIKNNLDGFQETFYLLEDQESLYASTASGVYYFDKGKNYWEDISSGIRTKDGNKNVYWLAKKGDVLYAATDEGLFSLEHQAQVPAHSSQFIPPFLLKGKIGIDFANLTEIEPSLIEVQKQALKFSSLPTTEDFKRYRLQARLRNLIPQVGFDINTRGAYIDYFQFEKGISTNISLKNQFDASKITRYQNDDQLFKQFSISWNTNQFLYDDEIREILNQARLSANIKENLLDDVTRIFYQRKKLQLSYLTNPPEDFQTRLEKDLELAELTGQLDSRTGGWFSKEIEKRKSRKNGTK